MEPLDETATDIIEVEPLAISAPGSPPLLPDQVAWLEARLDAIGDELGQLRRAAWATLESLNADAPRQAASSYRQLIVFVCDAVMPESRLAEFFDAEAADPPKLKQRLQKALEISDEDARLAALIAGTLAHLHHVLSGVIKRRRKGLIQASSFLVAGDALLMLVLGAVETDPLS